MNKTLIFIFYLIAGLLFFNSCEKGWLDAKPNKALIVPRSLEDYQALLDNRDVFGVNAPLMGELASNDSYLTDNGWASSTLITRNTYIWAQDIFEGEPSSDWTSAYSRIMQANIVLEGLEDIAPSTDTQELWNSVKGQALFHRSLAYFDLSQLFCNPYNVSTASSDLGLPLKLTSDVNERVDRSTLQETYDQIIGDLALAKQLLPESQAWKTKPTKIAASALLARIYLSIEDYNAAFLNANKCLESNGDLLNYNAINPLLSYPIPLFNAEVIWHGEMGLDFAQPLINGVIDSLLYNSYLEDDLRKSLFFRQGANGMHFRGNYRGAWLPAFCGFANDEMYLIRAECYVRNGEVTKGMADLNRLLSERWVQNLDGTSTYIDQVAESETEALDIILLERRKELIMRNVRWSDLRRLNRDERFQVTLTRVLNGKTYILPPNDLRYSFPIPPNEITFSGIEQNPR